MKPGTLVKIRKGYENSPEELKTVFEIVECFGDRADIRPIQYKYAFAPIEYVPIVAIEEIEQEEERK